LITGPFRYTLLGCRIDAIPLRGKMPTAAEIEEIEEAVRVWRHWVGNDILDELAIPEIEGRQANRFRARLALLNDAQTQELKSFFEIGVRRQDQWRPGFRLFVGHVAASVGELVPLTNRLKRFGITPFLAHEDINPGARWHLELTSALGSMDALISFHTVGFRASPWCGQEIGFALGRGVPVIPVSAGEDPSGFVSEIQGIRWNPQAAQIAEGYVIERLKSDPKTATAFGDALARSLKLSHSFNESDFLVGELDDLAELSANARRDIEFALKFNDQVRGRANARALIADEHVSV
jgi:TIR domain